MRVRALPSAERRAGQALLVLCLAAYAFVIPRGPQHNPDSRLALTYALVERGTLATDGYTSGTEDRAVRDGHYYTDKAPGVSFWMAPLYALAQLLPLSEASPGTSDRFVIRYLLTFLGIGIPHAAFVVWLFHQSRRIEPLVGPRAMVAAGYALGSPAYAYSVHAFGHVPAAMCLFLGAAALRSGRHFAAFTGGALLALATTLEYPAAFPAVVLAVICLRGSRPTLARRAALVALGAAGPLSALAAYHTAAFGAPWRIGYTYLDPASPFAAAQRSGFLGIGVPDPGVALALVLGRERGLLFLAPWLALAVPGAVMLWRDATRDRRVHAVSALAVLVALLVVNAGYAVWDGGAAWGPRHLTAALPFTALAALPAVARWPTMAGVLVVVSITLTAGGVATGTLPPPGSTAVGEFLLPALRDGVASNTFGALIGLHGWRGLVALGAVALLCWTWGAGAHRVYGTSFVCGVALVAAARLDASYVEYAEGYYLYLGSRIADGALLYQDVASTQTPLVPLIAGALWRVIPNVYLPRLFALGCYVTAAVLAGRLAVKLSARPALGQPATVLASLLPLGASSPHVFDPNALLAPLAPALALLVCAQGRPALRPVTAASVAVVGVLTKLTFLPLALAPLVTRSRSTARFGMAASVLLTLSALAIFAWFGPSAVDAATGELESPFLPAGAILAALQFVRLEGFALVLAGFAWWRLRGQLELRGVHAIALSAWLMPLLALHQGTFVSVARPAEPMIAAYSIAGAYLVAAHIVRWRTLSFAIQLAIAVTLPLAAVFNAPAPVRPIEAPLEWVRLYARGEEPILAPPFVAARAARPMLFDYADWTVLGMRARAGAEPERSYAGELVRGLEQGGYPFVISDFRLNYVTGAQMALERGYTRTASDGEGVLEVTLWIPTRRAAPAT